MRRLIQEALDIISRREASPATRRFSAVSNR
jgi:hypothetical protein